jgi:hypothetical protein
MTTEEKELLLKDLSARLPYGVKVAIEYSEGKYTRIYDLREIDNDVTSELRQRVIVWNYGIYSSVISYPLIDCRPYLRPMSSMTEEESAELSNIISEWFDKELFYLTEEPFLEYALSRINYSISPLLFDWLNEHYFDYRGLIPMGLALEAPEGMYN